MIFKCKGKMTPHFTWEEFSVGNDPKAEIVVTAEALLHAQLLEKFRVIIDKPMTVNAWYRTKEYNRAVGGIETSNHLDGTGTDIGWPGISKALYLKYSLIWAGLCREAGVNGETGLYKWGMHFGSSLKYTKKKFNHWDSRSGKQINRPFEELRAVE